MILSYFVSSQTTEIQNFDHRYSLNSGFLAVMANNKENSINLIFDIINDKE